MTSEELLQEILEDLEIGLENINDAGKWCGELEMARAEASEGVSVVEETIAKIKRGLGE